MARVGPAVIAPAGDDQHAELSELEHQVRDALAHLYDTVYLRTHPLARVAHLIEPSAPQSLLGKTLHKHLLDGVDAVRPEAGTSATSKALLRYRIMELRYIEGLDAPTVQQELAVSKSEYYREHGRALEAVAAALADRWGLDVQDAPDVLPALGRPPSPLQQEAGSLVAARLLEPLDLAGLVDDIVALLVPLAERRQVALQADRPADLAPCWADRVVVRQALLSVAHHAVDRAAPGVVHIRVAATSPAQLVIRAMRAPGAPSTWWGGDVETTRQLLESIGGRLESTVVDGALTVTFILPAGRSRTVLVIDNSADFATLIARYLEPRGWLVVGGCGLDEVRSLVEGCAPDVILLDVLMPGQDGWEVLRALRKLPVANRIPVVICSVLHEPQLALDLGANAYLPKPVRQPDLLRLVEELYRGTPAAAAAPPGRDGACP